MERKAMLLGAVLSVAQAAHGGTAHVEYVWVAPVPTWSGQNNSAYIDIPASVKTVTLPPGQAVITWSLGAHTSGDGYFRIRPVIGDQFPEVGFDLYHPAGVGHVYPSGTWATTTGGGEVQVKLQVRGTGGAPNPPFMLSIDTADSLAWTLVVHPQSGVVPAVSTWGLAAMALLVLGGATIAFKRMQTA